MLEEEARQPRGHGLLAPARSGDDGGGRRRFAVQLVGQGAQKAEHRGAIGHGVGPGRDDAHAVLILGQAIAPDAGFVRTEGQGVGQMGRAATTELEHGLVAAPDQPAVQHRQARRDSTDRLIELFSAPAGEMGGRRAGQANSLSLQGGVHRGKRPKGCQDVERALRRVRGGERHGPQAGDRTAARLWTASTGPLAGSDQ